jgi:hypothetical protein
MSEPLHALSRFTPEGSGLDRAALLFEAGRRSARPNRLWIALTALLALSQGVTLVLLWPPPRPQGVQPLGVPPAPRIEPGVPAPPESDPMGPGPSMVQDRRHLDRYLDEPVFVGSDRLAPDQPPLPAFSAVLHVPID